MAVIPFVTRGCNPLISSECCLQQCRRPSASEWHQEFCLQVFEVLVTCRRYVLEPTIIRIPEKNQTLKLETDVSLVQIEEEEGEGGGRGGVEEGDLQQIL